MAEPNFWDNQEQAQIVINENNELKQKYDNFKNLTDHVENLEVTAELLEMEDDPDVQSEFESELATTAKLLQDYRLGLLLNGKYDANNAIVEIHPGAGGTESQDWGSMLLRMYTRWAEQHQFKVQIEDYQAGEVAGISSVTMRIVGHNAYGYLRSEKGVHRLVRLSPFDSAGRRHTSFASVDVMPELDDSVEVNINQDDLRVDVYRSSGAGGQHINKTSSAVRMTHLPTGIVVAMQDQRSQQQNREKAMKILKARVYDYYSSKEQNEYDENRKSAIGTGDRSERIRTYNYPQNRVTDHRIGLSLNKLDRIMNGELDQVIDALILYDQTKALENLENE